MATTKVSKYPYLLCMSSYCATENPSNYLDSERGRCCSICDGSTMTVTSKEQEEKIWEHMGI